MTNATTRHLDNAAETLHLQVDKLLGVRAATVGGIESIDDLEIGVVADDAREVAYAVRACLGEVEKAHALLAREAERRDR